MNHVPRNWLVRFQLMLLVLDFVVIGSYLYTTFIYMPAAEHATTLSIHLHGQGAVNASGISALVAGLAGLHLAWCLGILWWLEKQRMWLAHGVATIIFGIMLVIPAASDNSLHFLYHGLLIVFMFFAAMCGPLAVGVIASFGFVMLILTSLGSGSLAHDPTKHVIEMVMIILATGAGTAGWYIFRKKYVVGQASNPDVAVLNSLVKQERTTVGLVLESITDGVMIIDPEGVVQVLNGSCAKLLGWPRDEAHGLRYDSLIEPVAAAEKEVGPKAQQAAPPPKETLAITDTFNSNRAQHKVSLIKTHEGKQIYVDIAASPIFQEGSPAEAQQDLTLPAPKEMMGIIAVLRDVDKRQREEAQRSEFISTASHEMRTPVAAIEGYLALAMNTKVSTVDAKARSYLEKAYASTQHLGRLFQDLLTSAKVEDGRLVSHPTPVEMGQFMEQLVDSLRFAAEKKGLQVSLAIGTSSTEGLPGVQKVVKPFYYVLADPERMREVITNLFDNAVKYSNEGKISIGLTGNEEVVQLFIKDTGMGIPAEDVSHLFQKFYRVDNSDTRTIGGTGLGLFICRKIVELYQGRIWVESELHKGSTFYINLPRLDTQKAESLKAQADADSPTAIPPMPAPTPSAPPPPPVAVPAPAAARPAVASTTVAPLTPNGS
jgi:signal transduction histidine kinase